jgi:hypothetical protein
MSEVNLGRSFFHINNGTCNISFEKEQVCVRRGVFEDAYQLSLEVDQYEGSETKIKVLITDLNDLEMLSEMLAGIVAKEKKVNPPKPPPPKLEFNGWTLPSFDAPKPKSEDTKYSIVEVKS